MRSIVSLVVLGTTLAAGLPHSAAAAESIWRRVAPADFFFSALMPTQPEVERFSRSSFVGNTDSVAYYSEAGETRMSISITDLPSAATWLAPLSVLFSQARSNLLETTNGIEQAFREVTRRGIEGKELLFTANPDDEPSRQAKAEFYYLDGRMLVIVASHPQQSSGSTMQRFFDHLEVDRRDCRQKTTVAAPACHVDIPLD